MSNACLVQDSDAPARAVTESPVCVECGRSVELLLRQYTRGIRLGRCVSTQECRWYIYFYDLRIAIPAPCLKELTTSLQYCTVAHCTGHFRSGYRIPGAVLVPLPDMLLHDGV